METKVDEYKKKANEMKESVFDQVQNMTKQTGEHVNKLMEKAGDMKGQVETEFQKKVDEMKKKYQDLIDEYEKAMQRALEMQKEAKSMYEKVKTQLSKGSQEAYEKAKELAKENMEIAKGYMTTVQDFFTQQMGKLTWEVRVCNHARNIRRRIVQNRQIVWNGFEEYI